MTTSHRQPCWLAMAHAILLFLGATVLAGVHPAVAQGTTNDSTGGQPLSLSEAVQLAEGHSPTLNIARNAVLRAQGQQSQTRSGLFPQLGASANYTRTLQSQFASAFSNSAPLDTSARTAPPAPCNQYILSASAPLANRVAGLEQYAQCTSASSATFGGIDFSQIGFGAPNAYTFGLSGSQNLFTGGRLMGQIQTAKAQRRSADIEVTAQHAQLILDVTQAYYTAALSDRLLIIAQASLQQAEDVLHQTQLQQHVGNTSEYDLLRATVSRDNERPIVIQRQSDRQLAYLRLKQQLHVPLDRPLRLTTAIEDTTATPPGVTLARAASPDTATDRRAPVREASEGVAAQEGQLRVVRSERIPSLALSSAYSRVAYPSGFVPSWSNFYPNWTVSLATSFPLFTGGRIHGDEMVARANLRDARDRLQQARDNAALDTRDALNTLQQAEATLAASQGTAGQADRAYQIAQVRYREGMSTQVELNDARNQLAQALINRAQAARDVLVARVRLALLPDLPIQTQGAGQAASQQQSQMSQQLQTSPSQPAQQSPAQQSTGQTSPVPTGVPSGGGF
jgi:outer membrane protein